MPAESRQVQEPSTVQQQIDWEITVGEAGRAIAGTFGGTYEHQSGGGGAGGYYEFTSIAELDSVITRLKAVRDTVERDGAKFQRAIALVQPPAADIMSRIQAEATRRSLQAGFEHNRVLRREADAAIAKLEAGRMQYACTEHGVITNLKKQQTG